MIQKTFINHTAYRGWYYWIKYSDTILSHDVGYWEYHNHEETYFSIY